MKEIRRSAEDWRLEIVMSRKDELFKLAQLFHSQARRTLDRPAKQALRELGDRYQNEAKKLQGQTSADGTSLTKSE